MNPDRLHRRAVLAYRRGEASRWVTAHACANGASLDALANDLPVSHDHLRRLKWAWHTYNDLRVLIHNGRDKERNTYNLRAARHALTVSHFARLGELWRRYEFHWVDAFDYLLVAALNGVSVGLMAEAIEGEHGGDERPEWVRRLSSALDNVQRAVDWAEAPERVRWLVMELEKETKDD